MKNNVDDILPEFHPGTLIEIGQAWGGRHWQSDLAREVGFDKSHITHILKKKRSVTVRFGSAVDRALVDKLEDVSRFLGHRGSPNKGNEMIREAKSLLNQAIRILRKVSPLEPRVTIAETTFRTKKPGPVLGRKRKKKN